MSNKLIITISLLIITLLAGCSSNNTLDYEENNLEEEIMPQVEYYTSTENSETGITTFEINKESIPKVIGKYTQYNIKQVEDDGTFGIEAKYANPLKPDDYSEDYKIILAKFYGDNSFEEFESIIKSRGVKITNDHGSFIQADKDAILFYSENSDFDIIMIDGNIDDPDFYSNNELLKWSLKEFGINSNKVESLKFEVKTKEDFDNYQKGVNAKIEQQSSAGAAITISRVGIVKGNVELLVLNTGTTDVTPKTITLTQDSNTCILDNTVTFAFNDVTAVLNLTTIDCPILPTLGQPIEVVIVTETSVISAKQIVR